MYLGIGVITIWVLEGLNIHYIGTWSLTVRMLGLRALREVLGFGVSGCGKWKPNSGSS